MVEIWTFFEFYNISNNDNEMMKDTVKLSKMQLKVISCSFYLFNLSSLQLYLRGLNQR